MDFRMASHVVCPLLCVACFWCASASNLLLRFFDQVDLPLSEAFCKLVLDQSDSFTVDDLKVLDSHVETV